MGNTTIRVLFFMSLLTLAVYLSFRISWAAEGKTWKAIEEMSEKELESWQVDPRWSYEIPRHKEFNYLPEEIYPFEPPFSGEEITFLGEDIIFPGRQCKNEAAHLALVNKRGHMLQITWMFKTKFFYDGFAEKLYKLKPGDVEVKHYLLTTFHPRSGGGDC